MCDKTCNICSQCSESCNCPKTITVCKPKKGCVSTVPANCIEDLETYLYKNLIFSDCIYSTLEVVNGKKKLKLHVNPACVNNYSSQDCIPVPLIPTITASNSTVLSGNKVILSASNYNGIILWYNQLGENIGSGTTINVSAGSYYAKSSTGCGVSNISNIITIQLEEEKIYTATRSTTVQKECLPNCVSTSVVFSKTYTGTSQDQANNLANTDASFVLDSIQYAQNNAECNCNYCSNALTWGSPIITCNSGNTTTVNISVNGNGTNAVEFYDYSLAGNNPYNPNGWVSGQSLNSYTSSTAFTSNASQHHFKARLKNCTTYIDGVVATCNENSFVYTASRTASFTRNNCNSGCTPSIVSFTKTYTSTASQNDANIQATNDTTFNTQGQAYANSNGVCTNCCTPPISALILGLATIQVNTNNVYTLQNVNSGVTYLWSITGTGVTLTNNTTSAVTVNASVSGTYTLSCVMSNSCGTRTESLIITVQSGAITPTITITDNIPSC
jgi:hypothetical protein